MNVVEILQLDTLRLGHFFILIPRHLRDHGWRTNSIGWIAMAFQTPTH